MAEGQKRKRSVTNVHMLEGSNDSRRKAPTKTAAVRNKDLSPPTGEQDSQWSAGSSAEGGKVGGRERRTRRREVGSGSSGETDVEGAGSMREKGGVKEVRVSARGLVERKELKRNVWQKDRREKGLSPMFTC